MTDDLKHKLDQLVADPPPPTTVPSQAVFARVRTARRRRTAGVATLATAAVVAVTVAAGNLTDINSAPPITNTPTAPATTSSPTATPTTTPVTPTPHKTTGSSSVTGAAHSPASHTPPPSSQHTTKTPEIPPLGVNVGLRPVINGRTVTMRVTVSGTELVPTDGINNRPLKDEDHSFFNMLGGTQYEFGDGGESGSDAGAVRCDRTTKYITGRETYSAETHTYAKPGTYTFHYRVNYCGKTGWVPATKTTTVTVK